jgi:hypothetical protein
MVCSGGLTDERLFVSPVLPSLVIGTIGNSLFSTSFSGVVVALAGFAISGRCIVGNGGCAHRSASLQVIIAVHLPFVFWCDEIFSCVKSAEKGLSVSFLSLIVDWLCAFVGVFVCAVAGFFVQW